MTRLVLFMKGILYIRMSSYMITPYRLRRPTTHDPQVSRRNQTSQRTRNAALPTASAPGAASVSVAASAPASFHMDEISELRTLLTKLNIEIDSIKSSIPTKDSPITLTNR